MTDHKIIIEPGPLELMCQHAEAAFPFECCGFMYGQEDGERLITLAVPVENSKEGDQRRRFEISPLEYMKAERFAIENQLQLLGVYHSHPDHPAIASQHDLAVAMPYFSYIIISVINKKRADIKSWQLNDGERGFAEESVLSQTGTPMLV